ncbi:MAG: hypothetical protein OEZ65_10330 [Gemmatimonadota bacterium]|nr:hypothetical protein [Gemmatimonadota bacterium]MDH5759975.1 hypothetical protein [Gemmatimonadota bacterium]
MLLRRLSQRLRSEDWITFGLELALVVIGILLAFQLDRAYQASQDRDLEQRYLERLAIDLRRDSVEMEENVQRTLRRLEQVKLLEAVLDDPGVAANDPRGFAFALEQVTWRSVPTISTSTYDELRSTGRMVLLRSEELRRDLSDYYAFISEQQRLGLGEDDQDRFRGETLGLLSGAQLSAIEDRERYPFEMSPGEAVRIARAFAARDRVRSWLGRIDKYQVLMGRLSRDFLTRTVELLNQVDSVRDGSS